MSETTGPSPEEMGLTEAETSNLETDRAWAAEVKRQADKRNFLEGRQAAGQDIPGSIVSPEIRANLIRESQEYAKRLGKFINERSSQAPGVEDRDKLNALQVLRQQIVDQAGWSVGDFEQRKHEAEEIIGQYGKNNS